jgi:predicted heme/steroid binding protein
MLFFLFCVPPYAAYALPEYAETTGRACGRCHVSTAGGGTLTGEGEGYKEELRRRGLYMPISKARKVIRFFVGYLHVVTAVVWFGAIAYVHIILKPAYAARGLPRGELRLGWISIIILAATGTLLGMARVPSMDALLHTRFGILLLVKIFLFLVMVATASVVTFVIGPMLKKRPRPEPRDDQKDFLTPGTLSNFDGKEGKPACVAYKGIVYDVTASRMWKEGNHVKRHLAGTDLTAAMAEAPHGEEKITAMPVSGKLTMTDGKKPQRPAYERVFYFLAYFNLVMIFLIMMVIALWRWG